jgi:hypothetical protein
VPDPPAAPGHPGASRGPGSPLDATVGGFPGWAVFLLLASLAVLAAEALMVATGAGAEVVDAAGFLAAITLPLVLGGLWLLVWRERCRFADGVVHCHRQRLWGSRTWQAPLADYQGVAVETGRSGYATGARHVVLRHRALRSRDARLCRANSFLDLWHHQRSWARALGLPLLVATADGEVRVPAADVGVPLRRRRAHGPRPEELASASPPTGRRLSVSVEGQALRFEARSLRMLLRLLGWVPGLPGVIAALAGFLAPVEELQASPWEVRRSERFLGMRWRAEVMPADEVEAVLVLCPVADRRWQTVAVLGRFTAIEFGLGLSTAQHAWVRDCIIAVLRAEPPSPPGASMADGL